jgi:predicted metal-dependent peptidase
MGCVATKDPVGQRARDLALGLGWQHPWLLAMVCRVKAYLSDPGTKTASVALDGTIRIGPQWWNVLPRAQQRGVVLHELLHPILRHWERQGARAAKRWAVTCDKEINQLCKDIGVELPPDAYYPAAGHERMSAEQLYDAEESDERPTTGELGQGCAALPAPGEPQPQESGKSPDDSDTPEVSLGDAPSPPPPSQGSAQPPQLPPDAVRWGDVAAQCRAMARTCGCGSAAAIVRALEPPTPIVKWAQLLRSSFVRASSAHGSDTVSSARRGRRSGAEGPQFPGGISLNCQAAVVIDASGSVTDKSLAVAVGNVLAVARATTTRAYLVIHDSKVQWAGWIKPSTKAAEVFSRVSSRGGTSFGPAYAAVTKAGRFDAIVHLTDGECWDKWPRTPRGSRLVVGLLGAKSKDHVPAGARVVEVEI